MKLSQTIFLLLLLLNVAEARLYWVFLEDDPGRPNAIISEQAAERIAIRGTGDVPGSKLILPEHLEELEALGIEIITRSRFLNAASVDVRADETLQKIQQLPFVTGVQPVGSRPLKRKLSPVISSGLGRITPTPYGDSYNQNAMLGIPVLHDLGYDGSGVLIALFDTGFNQVHPAFGEMDIQKTYDFVDKDEDVSTSVLSNHGDDCLSVIGGYAPGELIGPAHGASYLLARTEDISSESRVEEHNWLAAVEWADALGVEIISSSLAYFDHDDPADDYPFSALDGNTTIVAQAANIAASRGILVVNAMGNEGPGESSLWSPADSPNILAVGAITPDEVIAGFSSRGPTADGRIKPDVVAQGTSVQMVSGESGYKLGRGTSYSTPLIAGLAALLLQSSPDLSPDSAIKIFKKNGDRAGGPDNTYGYGIPQFVHLFDEIEDKHFLNNLTYPNPSTFDFVHMVLPYRIPEVVEHGELYDIRGRYVGQLSVEPVSRTTLRLTLPADIPKSNQLYIVAVRMDNKLYSGKFVYIKS